MAVLYDRIPLALRQREQWVCWALEEHEDKQAKVPAAAATGKRASNANPSTWVSFDKALASCERNDCPGTGFVFGPQRRQTVFTVCLEG